MSGAIVLDTNVFVRAVLSGSGMYDAILTKVGSEKWNLCYGLEQIEELNKVLTYERIVKKYPEKIDGAYELVKWIYDYGVETRFEIVDMCRDPKDNYVIGLALAAGKYEKVVLVTGDKDILVLKNKIKNVVLMTPGKFLEMGD